MFLQKYYIDKMDYGKKMLALILKGEGMLLDEVFYFLLIESDPVPKSWLNMTMSLCKWLSMIKYNQEGGIVSIRVDCKTFFEFFCYVRTLVKYSIQTLTFNIFE